MIEGRGWVRGCVWGRVEGECAFVCVCGEGCVCVCVEEGDVQRVR